MSPQTLAYVAQLLEAATRFPHVGLVVVQPGAGSLHVLRGDDPHVAERLDELIAGACYPVAVAGFGADDSVSLEPVQEYAGQRWTHRYLLLLGERLRAQLAAHA